MQLLDGSGTEKGSTLWTPWSMTPSAISLGKVFEAGPEVDSGPLVFRHMGCWLRRWEQEATSKKPFLLAGNPLGWYARAMP